VATRSRKGLESADMVAGEVVVVKWLWWWWGFGWWMGFEEERMVGGRRFLWCGKIPRAE